MRRKILFYSYLKLIAASTIIAVVCCLLAFSLKHLTERAQHLLFTGTSNINALLLVVLPSVGITAIYFLRKYLFKNRKNKGIKEIYTTLETRKDHLPFFKIPSHYINGFLTVVFGGSTGVEVSTVVATATVGNQVYKQRFIPLAFKRELICAGVAAGVTVLFGSALGGWLFAVEVIAKKLHKTVLLSCTVATVVAYAFVQHFDRGFLVAMPATEWRSATLPFILALGCLGGLLATYFTHAVIRCKTWFGKIKSNFVRVNLGALIVGGLIFFFPFLYGDSYHGLASMLEHFSAGNTSSLLVGTLAALVFLKPLAASLTLGAGGDGGVFAPSIVSGAFLGILVAYWGNSHFGADLSIINFALVGAAATLSAAIHGPVTSVFLISAVAPHGERLFIPLAIAALISYMLSKALYPYNVYTYPEK